MKTLRDAKINEVVVVRRLHGEGPVKRRIMDMGITKGVQIQVRKSSASWRSYRIKRSGL